jgi:stress-induced-phosphoprotein 1
VGREEALRLKEQGNAHYRKREFDRALELYAAACKANPDASDISFQLNEAAVHFELKDYARTVQVCEDAIATGRDHRAPFALIAKVRAIICGSCVRVSVCVCVCVCVCACFSVSVGRECAWSGSCPCLCLRLRLHGDVT